MNIEITKKVAYEAKFIQVNAKVRYWEDSRINGVDDENGDLMPFRVGENWCPKIDIDGGFVIDWPIGTIADVHYKVCDCCGVQLLTEDGSIIAENDDYVPSFLSPKKPGYGDYIIMDIDENGKIHKWKTDSIQGAFDTNSDTL